MPADGKIKSKDLSYDAALPPFLQRLKARNSGECDPDRHEVAIARPKRAKDANEDDGPTMVDESGETISKEDYELLTKGNGEAKVVESIPTAAGLEAARPETKLTEGTATKKRKMAKVVGEDSADLKDDADAPPKTVKKVKKKSKPIKLAFNDDGDET